MLKEIKILIVDDSRIYRSLVAKTLEDETDIRVVGSVMNGRKAVDFIEEGREIPDIVTLDQEMPEMDGLSTLNAIEAFNRKKGTKIACIMLSAFTQKGSEITLKALEAGAFDFIAKPQAENADENFQNLKNQLLTKIRAFQLQRKTGREPSFSGLIRKTPEKTTEAKAGIVLIGSSTGGPKALMTLLPELCEKISQPIALVQHMPPKFTASLAESLDRKCRHKVLESRGGEVIESEHVYIAPGGRHMVIRKDASGRPITGLNDQPPENGCRPAVDVLFRSAASKYGGDALALVLTGMGSDGTKGLAPLQRAGAHILVQDEASSVVWGMPGSAVAAGRVHEILPLEKIAEAVASKCS
jgi:two-component system chemotaxis response regulator CheB